MELRQLKYVMVLAQVRHFGQAAQILGIRQPSLSQQIARLESELGVALFERNHRGVTITPAGEIFVDRCSRALDWVDQAVAEAGRAGRGETGRLAVSFLGSTTYTLLPNILRNFHELNPDVEIVPSQKSSAEQAAGLIEGTLDVGFVRPPLLAEHMRHLSVMPVAREILIAALPAEHPLASRKVIPTKMLSGEPLIIGPRSVEPASHDTVQNACHSAGFQPVIAAQAAQLHTILGLVAAGLGIGVGPSSFDLVRRPDVTCRPLTPRTYMPNLSMTWRPNCSPPAARFVRLVRDMRAVRSSDEIPPLPGLRH